MKRTYILLPVLVLLLAMLAGCECKHQWTDADCLTPKTCAQCQATEGEALGHDFAPASCAAPETCTRCGETHGEVLGHEWQDATCETPKTCTVCQETEGTAAGHMWQDATCLSPMICSACEETQGEIGGHPFDQIMWYPVWEDGELVDVEKMSGPCICGTWIETDMDWELSANALIQGHWEFHSVITGNVSQKSYFEEGENYLDVFPDGTATMVLLGETADLTWSYTYPENVGIWFDLVAEDGSKAELSIFIFKKRPESEINGMLIIDRWYMLDIRK